MFKLTEYKSKSLQKLVSCTNITFNQQILTFQPCGYTFKHDVLSRHSIVILNIIHLVIFKSFVKIIHMEKKIKIFVK